MSHYRLVRGHMKRYETLMLTVPEITVDEQKSLEKNLEKVVKGHKGQLIAFDRWGKYKISYPIRKNEYGVYFLSRMEVPADQKDELLKDLEEFFSVKEHQLIMRHMSVALKPGQTLEYKHPESLEDTPTKDVDTFLKENKMTGLMGKPKVTRRPKSEDMPQRELEQIEKEEAQIQEANESDIVQDEPDLA